MGRQRLGLFENNEHRYGLTRRTSLCGLVPVHSVDQSPGARHPQDLLFGSQRVPGKESPRSPLCERTIVEKCLNVVPALIGTSLIRTLAGQRCGDRSDRNRASSMRRSSKETSPPKRRPDVWTRWEPCLSWLSGLWRHGREN